MMYTCLVGVCLTSGLASVTRSLYQAGEHMFVFKVYASRQYSLKSVAVTIFASKPVVLCHDHATLQALRWTAAVTLTAF